MRTPGFEPSRALRGELDAQPALAGERPERSEGKRLQARSQSLSPSHIKKPAQGGFFNMDSGVCGFEPGSNRAALGAASSMRSPPWRASDPSVSEGKRHRRAVNPSPPAILKDPPGAGFLICIEELTDVNAVSTLPRMAWRTSS